MHAGSPRLLVINPNTTPLMTARVAERVRDRLPGVRVSEATGRFGARYIASRASFAVAGHAALECFADFGAGCDAVLLACFGDPGLDALREVSPVPVIGLIEASVAVATAGGQRFSIVTGGERWEPMLWEALRLRRLDQACASVRAVAPTGGMIASDPDAAVALLAQACAACMADDGAGTVILGGAGLLGLAERVQPLVAVPVICSVEAGIGAAAEALTARAAGALSLPAAVETVGLSPALAQIFQSSVRNS
jgi:Asp/Glu/hydantoin racemase